MFQDLPEIAKERLQQWGQQDWLSTGKNVIKYGRKQIRK